MTCPHCEAAIAKAVKALDGVGECGANFRASSVKVFYDDEKVTPRQIEDAITEAGYRVKQSNNFADWLQLAGILLAAAAVYFAFDHFVGFDFIPDIEQEMSYGLLLLAGVLTSVHCVSMCGGINIAVCVASKSSAGSEFAPSAMYNAGRVVSYTAIGGIVGAIGSVFSFSPVFQDWVLIVSGGLMVLTGLTMLGLFNFIKFTMPAGLSEIRKKAVGKPAFVVGLANGLMPCGPLQMMQLYALGTGSAAAGALAMFIFVIGTVPLMFGLGFLSSKLKGKTAAKFSMASAIIIIMLGLGMLSRLIPTTVVTQTNVPPAPKAAQQEVPKVQEIPKEVQISQEPQVIITDVGRRSYPAIKVKKGVPVRWILNVAQGSLNGCNNRFTIPFLNITKSLKLGENVVEFTANEAGTFTYQCWMNMIRSTITVE